MAVVEVSAPSEEGALKETMRIPCEVSVLETGPAERGVAAAPGIRVISIHALSRVVKEPFQIPHFLDRN